MARNFSELLEPILADPKRRERIEALGEQFAAEDLAYQLAELRKGLGITQAELATRLGITQGAVSQMEQAPDPKLSTVRRHVEALGATMQINITLPESVSAD